MSARDYAIQGLVNLLKLVVGRGRVKSLNDDGAVQILQTVLSPKETANLKRLAEFGFASRPPNDSDVIALFVGGDRSNGVVIASGNQRLRFKLENDGEVALHDAFGKSLWFKKNGGVVLEANGQNVEVNGAADVTINATGTVTVNAGAIDLTADTTITGNIHVTGNAVVDGTIGDGVRTIEADRAIYNSHTHPNGAPNSGPPNQHQ